MLRIHIMKNLSNTSIITVTYYESNDNLRAIHKYKTLLSNFEDFSLIDNNLSKAFGIIDTGSTYRAQSNYLLVDNWTVSEPSNKNVVKQDIFYSTKK